METKNTILSKKDASLLEELIVRNGRIVTFAQIKKAFSGDHSAAVIGNRVAWLAKTGWLTRVKKGLYIVNTDLSAMTSSDISITAIAQALNRDSYISFESALQYHGMFDQMLSSVGAVTFRRARSYKIQNTTIRFFKADKRLYFGYASERLDLGLVKMAEKEKAVLDILYFRRGAYYASLVWEKLKNYRNDLDFDLLKQYAKKYNLTVIRRVGFFLDRLDIDTEDLHKLVAGKNTYSKMTSDSRRFNAKWRIYFDNRIID